MGNKYIVGDLYVNDSKVITEDTLPESSNFSGSYNDLTDKPTIPTVPTNVSAFTNDSGYLTEVPSEYVTNTELEDKIANNNEATLAAAKEDAANKAIVVLGEAQAYTDAAIANIGISGGGFTIKKVEFTDRPSLYAWLQNNVDRVIKASMNTNQFPAPVIFTNVIAESGEYGIGFCFQHFYGWFSNQLTMDMDLIRVRNDVITRRHGELGSSVSDETIPDEYWTALNVSVTIYYIE